LRLRVFWVPNKELLFFSAQKFSRCLYKFCFGCFVFGVFYDYAGFRRLKGGDNGKESKKNKEIHKTYADFNLAVFGRAIASVI
jgi:hypothetical protein